MKSKQDGVTNLTDEERSFGGFDSSRVRVAIRRFKGPGIRGVGDRREADELGILLYDTVRSVKRTDSL